MNKWLNASVYASFFVISCSSVWANDVELKTVIDQVTVYPDGAQLIRQGKFDIPAGSSNLILRGLPASLDTQSLRVDGQGNSTFSIGAVDVKLVPADVASTVDPVLESAIKSLKEQRDKIFVQISAMETKKATIERYAQAGPERSSVDTKPLEPSVWANVWDLVGNGLLKVSEELRVLKAQMRDLDAEIQAKERARARPLNAGAPKRDVMITVEAAAALSGTLRVSYRVSGASWQPVYDARLVTNFKSNDKDPNQPKSVQPKLELTRRAQIQQRTGEEWSNVRLSVATARTQRGTAAPELPALQVGYVEMRPVLYKQSRAMGGLMGGLASSARSDSSNMVLETAQAVAPAPLSAPAVEDKTAQEQFAQVDASSYQAQFKIVGQVSVPQDGASKTFALSQRTYDPRLIVKTVPVLDETAYLQAQFINEDDVALLSGDVLLHRDQNYVGKGRIAATPSGERVELGFGATDQVSVSRVPVRRKETDPAFYNSTKSDTREFKTTVKNTHPFPVSIVVQDRVPFSETSTLTVEVLNQTTPVTPQNTSVTTQPAVKEPATKEPVKESVQNNDRRGIMTWQYELASQETREIKFAYRMKWPAEKELEFVPQPVK